jgi:hypothetical protein
MLRLAFLEPKMSNFMAVKKGTITKTATRNEHWSIFVPEKIMVPETSIGTFNLEKWYPLVI